MSLPTAIEIKNASKSFDYQSGGLINPTKNNGIIQNKRVHDAVQYMQNFVPKNMNQFNSLIIALTALYILRLTVFKHVRISYLEDSKDKILSDEEYNRRLKNYKNILNKDFKSTVMMDLSVSESVFKSAINVIKKYLNI